MRIICLSLITKRKEACFLKLRHCHNEKWHPDLRLRTEFEPLHDKTNKKTVCPAKTQISLGIHPVWSEASLCTQWVAKDPSFLHADSEDSDQTGRKPRLIWVFAGCTLILLGLSWHGSFIQAWIIHVQLPVACQKYVIILVSPQTLKVIQFHLARSIIIY